METNWESGIAKRDTHHQEKRRKTEAIASNRLQSSEWRVSTCLHGELPAIRSSGKSNEDRMPPGRLNERMGL
jgi:hypothetical protein